MNHDAAELRELRADIRHWRRGRANTTLVEVLGDAYVAVFAVLMIGSMAGNAFWQLGHHSRQVCTSVGCLAARGALPWLGLAALLVLVLAVARMTGPVFVTPASASWLATAPVDRGALLRPRLLSTASVAALLTLIAATVVVLLAGFPIGVAAATAVLVAALAAAVAAAAALVQDTRGVGAARVLTALVLLAIWAGLLGLALGRVGRLPTPSVATPWWIAAVVAVLVATGLLVLALRSLPRLRHRAISPGGHLVPGLSGALAGLDFSLAYDVWLGQRWSRADAVRPRRGGPSGPRAIVFTDLVRVRRSPGVLLAPAAVVVVPYVAHTAGAERSTALIGALALFAALLPLLPGMRVLSRTPGLTRLLPWPSRDSRLTSVIVPGVVALVAGLAMAPVLADAFDADAVVSPRLGLAVALTALVAAVRWMCAAPPDYGRPLLSTPAGAVPVNLYSSAFRGFDMVVLGTAPLLLFAPTTGAWVSLAVMGIALSYLLSKD